MGPPGPILGPGPMPGLIMWAITAACDCGWKTGCCGASSSSDDTAVNGAADGGEWAAWSSSAVGAAGMLRPPPSRQLPTSATNTYPLRQQFSQSMAEWLGGRSWDPQVVGSNPGHRAAECNPGQVLYTYVPLSPSSIIWYRSMGGDARRLGR